MAEVYGNRTHRAYLPVNPTGFEVQASHQARFTSAEGRIIADVASRVQYREIHFLGQRTPVSGGATEANKIWRADLLRHHTCAPGTLDTLSVGAIALEYAIRIGHRPDRFHNAGELFQSVVYFLFIRGPAHTHAQGSKSGERSVTHCQQDMRWLE